MIKWNTTKEDDALIKAIVDRVDAMNGEVNLNVTRTLMDITAVHANGCPLKLKELSEADEFNLCHDVFGIIGNIDRETAKLTNCFRPRYAQ